jgi:predicted secreted protein
VRKQIFKSIFAFFITIGLFGSLTALFTIFFVVLPDIRNLMVPINDHSVRPDKLVSEAIYELVKKTIIQTTIASAVLTFSVVGLWHFLKKWHHERKIENKKSPSI